MPEQLSPADWRQLVRERLAAMDLDPAREAEIIEEIAQHAADRYADALARGEDESRARAGALLIVADGQRLATDISTADRPRISMTPPAARSSEGIGGLWRDVRFAIRVLRHAPGFAITAILTLAIGIGANTTIFSLVNTTLLRPLPYRDPDRLVLPGERASSGRANNVGYTTFVDWRSRAHSFEELALVRSWTPTLVTDGQAERVAGMRVTPNYLTLLGVQPALGRDFRADEDHPDRWRVVIISDRLWRTRFGADPNIAGRVITMNDRQFTIVGVLAESFEPLISEHFYTRADIWAPLGYATSLPSACRTCQHLKAIGRLRAGVSPGAAQAELDAIHQDLKRAFPSEYEPASIITVVNLHDDLTRSVRPALAVLMAAVVLVLVIGCANVASLLLARMAGRERHLALHTALGASRGRLVRQLLMESLVVSLAAGALGVIVCVAAIPAIARLAPLTIPRLDAVGVDRGVLLFSLGISILTAIAFGLLPALRASRVDVRSSLHLAARGMSRVPLALHQRFVVAIDIALAVVLLVSAGLMIRTVGRLARVDPGFDSRNVLTMQISMVGARYAEDAQVRATLDAILTRVRALPGVASAAAAGQIPLGGDGDQWGFHIQSRPSPNPANDSSVERYAVTPAYFDVMHIPLRRGRLLDDRDRSNSEFVMLIGEHTARTLWPRSDPLGEFVRIGDAVSGPWRKIVGVVGDVRHQSISDEPTLQMYTPQSQNTDSFLTLVLRTEVDPASLTGAARQAIASVAKDIPVYQVAPLDQLVARSVAPRRFVMLVLELFAAVAVLLTAIGIYGVLSQSVTDRTRELGIRTALGASRSAIVRLVLTDGTRMVVLGLIAGVAASLGMTRLLSGSLYEVSARDPLTLAVVAALLLFVATIAQLVPIGRALSVDPAITLRNE